MSYCRWIGGARWGVALGALAWLVCVAVWAAAQQTSPGDGGTLGPAASAATNAPTSEIDPKRKKLVDTIARQLGKMKPIGNPKKELSDSFLLGTAELTLATGHADVRFQVVQGQQQAAEFLADYVLAAPPKVVRKWHVFSRQKDSQQGEEALGQIRSEYDRMAAYQAQLKKIYAATTIRRT